MLLHQTVWILLRMIFHDLTYVPSAAFFLALDPIGCLPVVGVNAYFSVK